MKTSDKELVRIEAKELSKKPDRRKISTRAWVGHTPDAYWACDLIDFTNIKTVNNGYSFILVCVDIYSRFVHLEPMKSKTVDSLKTAYTAVFDRNKDSVFKQIRKPRYICFDEEKSVMSPMFKDWLKNQNIYIYHPKGKHKVSIAERYIRTFKEALSEHFTRYRRHWFDYIEEIAKDYNNSKHASLSGKTPDGVYNGEELHLEIEAEPKDAKQPAFKVNDRVRFRLNKKLQGTAKKSLMSNWSLDTFIVNGIDRRKPQTGYRLTRESNMKQFKPTVPNQGLIHELNSADKRLFYPRELIKSKLTKQQVEQLKLIPNIISKID